MNRLRSKPFALTLAFILLLSVFAGCTSSGDSEPSGGSQPEEAVSSSADPLTQADEEAPDALDISWDNPDISWRKDTSPVTMTLFLDIPYLTVDVWGEDDVSKQITEDTGITFEVTKTVDANQIQVIFASGDYPDIVYGDAINKFANPPVAMAWDELIDEYAPEFRYQLDTEEKFVNLREDGHYYTIRSHFNRKQDYENPFLLPSGGEPTLHLRQDIMDELGNPPLESLEDLVAIYGQVKEKYPNLIPFLYYPDYPTTFKENYGFQRDADYDENGVYLHNYSMPEYVEYFKFMNRLYNEGYMPIESFSYKHEQFIQVMDNGDCFSALYNTGLSDSTNEKFDTRGIEGMRYAPVTKSLTVNGEDRTVVHQGWGGWATTIITTSCETPDRAIRLMQYLYSDYGRNLTSFGIEGVHYNWTDDGLVKSTDLVLNTDPADRSKRFTGNWGFMAHEVWAGINVYSNAAMKPDYATALSALQFKASVITNDVVKSMVQLPPDSDLSVIDSKVREVIKAREIEMITAATEEEVETIFGEIVSQLEAVGLKELEAFYTEEYARAKVRHQEYFADETEARDSDNVVE